MSKAELNELAKTFEIENPTKIKKDDLVAQIVEIQAQRSGLEKANGVLDVLPEGYGFLRREGYLVGADDIYISQSQIRRFELRRGDLVAGPSAQAQREREVLRHRQGRDGQRLPARGDRQPARVRGARRRAADAALRARDARRRRDARDRSVRAARQRPARAAARAAARRTTPRCSCASRARSKRTIPTRT